METKDDLTGQLARLPDGQLIKIEEYMTMVTLQPDGSRESEKGGLSCVRLQS